VIAAALVPVIALLLHVVARQHERIRLDLRQQAPGGS
jgi:hypothetical protein